MGSEFRGFGCRGVGSSYFKSLQCSAYRLSYGEAATLVFRLSFKPGSIAVYNLEGFM